MGPLLEVPSHQPAFYLGTNNATNPDTSQHPYWRSEMMQKVTNLTTVRTHQYAVGITIGFFEVKREGDPMQIVNGAPLLAVATFWDLSLVMRLARRRGTGRSSLSTGLKLYGFDDTTPGSFPPSRTLPPDD